MNKILLKNWPFIAIIIIWIIFSAPFLIKGLVPFPTKFLVTFFPPWSASYAMPVKNNAMPDVITQIYPWKLLTINTWKMGQVPLWNPYSFSGTTHAANYQSAVFSPFNLLYLLFSFVTAWSFQILLQPLLAGFFTYIFLDSLGRSRPASLIGAVGFMFCGFLTTWMAYGTLGYAVLWLPLLLFAVNRQNHKISWLNGIIISLGLAFSFTSGHFQISIYVISALLLFIIFKLISTRRLKANLYLLVYIIFGILLVAPQLLLTYSAYAASVRSQSFVKGEVIPWQYIITLLAPDFYGNPVTRNDWFGHFAEWASYVGLVPILLVIYGIIAGIKGYKKFFLFSGISAILLSYQTPLVNLLYLLKIPVISTSAASRIIVLASFSLISLAAFGFDDLMADWNAKSKKNILCTSVVISLLIMLTWGVLLLGSPFPSDKLMVAKRNFILPTIIFISGLGVMSLGFLSKKIRYLAVLSLIVIAGFDSLRYAIKWMPFEPKDYIYPNSKMISYLQKKIGDNRVYGNLGGEVGVSERLPLIEGYDAMYQGRYGRFANAVSKYIIDDGERSVVNFSKNGTFIEQALELLGVRYFVHRLSDGRSPWAYPVWKYPPDIMKSIYRDESYEIFEYAKAYPRTFLASDYQIGSSEKDIINRLFTSGIDRHNTLILEKKPDLNPQIGDGQAKIVFYTANEVIIETEANVPKLLFLSDVYDQGWQVFVDNKPVNLYRADYDFRAVALPKGNHLVRFKYNPIGFQIGIKISLLAIILILSFGSYNIYENRHI